MQFAQRNILMMTVILCLSILGWVEVRAEDNSKEVKLADLPAAAQKTIQDEADHYQGRADDVEEVHEDGEMWYDVELVKNRNHRSIGVAPDGKIVSRQVFMREIPEAVRKTIRAQIRPNKDKLGDIDQVMNDNRIVYEVEFKKDSRDVSFSVAADGRLLTIEMAFLEIPEPVQKSIRLQAAGGVIKRIEKNTEDNDGEVVYDVDVQQPGGKISFSFSAAGELIEE